MKMLFRRLFSNNEEPPIIPLFELGAGRPPMVKVFGGKPPDTMVEAEEAWVTNAGLVAFGYPDGSDNGFSLKIIKDHSIERNGGNTWFLVSNKDMVVKGDIGFGPGCGCSVTMSGSALLAVGGELHFSPLTIRIQ